MNDFFDYLKSESKEENTTAEMKDLELLWHASRAEVAEPPPADESWAAIQARIAQAEDNVVPMPEAFQRRTHYRPLLALAAILILSVVGVMMTRNQAFDTGRGMSHTVTLQDASSVALNSDSRLTLMRGFNKDHRNVKLQGEAFFMVEKGSAPFIIEAGDARIRVVGTEFNVYARDDEVRLDVLEGEVEFWSQKEGESTKVSVKAGQKSVIKKGNDPKKPEDTDENANKPAWMNNEIICNDTPISEICKELERRFDVTIQLSDAVKAAKNVDGRFIATDLKTAMNTLISLDGMEQFKWSFKDGVYVFE